MPIRFIDRNVSLGRIASSTASVVGALAGTHTAPASRTGVISSQLGDHTGLMSGVFQVNANRSGTVSAAVSGATSLIQGTASLPGGSSGFAPSGVFSYSGTAGHNLPLVISRSTGTFAARSFGTGAPWLYDTISAQYRNGSNLNAYAALSDGALIPTTVWQDNSLTSTPSAYYSTSRTKRSAQYAAVYTNAGHTPEKMGVGRAIWPSTWGSQTNTRMYVSWWARCALGWEWDAPGGDTPSSKPFRVNDSAGAGGGTNFVGAGGGQTMCLEAFATPGGTRNGFITGGGFFPGDSSWCRVELMFDRSAQTGDMWINGAYCKFEHSAAGGWFEFRPSALKLYTPNTSNDNRWVPVSFTSPGINVGLVGYDDGHGSSAGQITDIQEIYVDSDLQRFEISDSPVWNTGLSATATREVCGRWTRNSDTQCTVYPNQGGWTSLSGKYLWYVTSVTTAELVGQFT